MFFSYVSFKVHYLLFCRALKESGYESDSTLIFRRREADPPLLSPKEQKQAYREVQAGGEPPLHGFRKPAPDRPKGTKRS